MTEPDDLDAPGGEPVPRVVVVAPDAGEAETVRLELVRRMPEADATVEVVVAGLADAAPTPEEADGLVSDLVAVVGDGRGVVLVGPQEDACDSGRAAMGRACLAAAARTGCRSWGYPRPSGSRAVDGDFVEQRPVDEALERLHAEHDEPWEADTRWYERRKRALLLAMLPRERYHRAWEVGCSTGVLTEQLRTRSDHVVGTDTSETAVARARRRCAATPGDRAPTTVGQVTIRRRHAAEPWGPDLPDGGFDLVVLSEVGYFLHTADLERLVRTLRTETPGADVVLCHWRHDVVGWPLDGPTVHERIVRMLGTTVLARYVDRDVEIVVLGPASSRPNPAS